MIKALVASAEGLVPSTEPRTLRALAARGLVAADAGQPDLYADGVPLTEDGRWAVRVLQDPTTTAAYAVGVYWYCQRCRPAEGTRALTFADLRLGIFRYRCDGCGLDLDRGDDKE